MCVLSPIDRVLKSNAFLLSVVQALFVEPKRLTTLHEAVIDRRIGFSLRVASSLATDLHGDHEAASKTTISSHRSFCFSVFDAGTVFWGGGGHDENKCGCIYTMMNVTTLLLSQC